MERDFLRGQFQRRASVLVNAVGGMGGSDMPPGSEPFDMWAAEQPITALHVMDQPIVDRLVSIIRKVWENVDLSEEETNLLVTIVARR